jgi:purine-binding chemotaxis protein CheW
MTDEMPATGPDATAAPEPAEKAAPAPGVDAPRMVVEEVLRQRAESLSLEEATETDDRRVSILLFNLGDETYGVSIDGVREIYNVYRMTPIPCVPDSILGVINIRGEIISVTDLRALMVLGRTEYVEGAEEQPPMIIVVAGEVSTALLVDAIGDIVDVAADRIDPPVAGWDKTQSEYVSGSFYTGEQLVALVNLSKVLTPVGGE